MERIGSFLRDKFSVYVKKEVFNLLSLVAHLPIKDDTTRHRKGQLPQVFDRIEPSLNYVKKLHFPVRTSDLKPSSNAGQNLLIIVQAFLNLAIITKNLKVIRHLYQCIREHATFFESQLKNSLNIIITQHINELPTRDFLDCANGFIEEFLQRGMDTSVKDNIRWAIARKIILRIMETCSQHQLEELLVVWNTKWLQVLQQTEYSEQTDPVELFNFVQEQTYLMDFYEVVYRRLPLDKIKGSVHTRLYGDSTAQNELSKALIAIAHQAKSGQIRNFSRICADIKPEFVTNEGGKEGRQAELEKAQYSHQAVQTKFCCSAYSLLSSVIVRTQTNEVVFANFLFNPRQGEASQSLWSLLIDTEKDFEFKVQTHFNHVQLQSIEQKLADSAATTKDFAGARIQNMMKEYLTSTFMGAGEQFNQNMVFETQLDAVGLKQEQQKLQELIKDRIRHNHSSNAQSSSAS